MLFFKSFSVFIFYFMKKPLFILLTFAALTDIMFVSCDKEQISEPEPVPENPKTVVMIHVVDSTITRNNGQVSVIDRKSYDSSGKISKAVRYHYINGILADSAVYTYEFSKNTADDIEYTEYLAFNGGPNEIKRHVRNYGTGKNVTSSMKAFVNVGGKWRILEYAYFNRENDNQRMYEEKYGILNGNSVLLSRKDTTIVYHAGTNRVSDIAVSAYLCPGKLDKSDPLSIRITSTGPSRWINLSRKYDQDGRIKEENTGMSPDSITWKRIIGVHDYVFNEKGRLKEETFSQNGVNESKRVVTFTEDGLYDKIDYFTWSDSKGAFEPAGSVRYVQGEPGRLDSVIINSVSNIFGSGILPIVADVDGLVPLECFKSPNLTDDEGLGSKCVIKCGDFGQPLNETLYRKQPDGTYELLAANARSYNENIDVLENELRSYENGEWSVAFYEKYTYDSESRILSYYGRRANSTETQESEEIEELRREYDSFGNCSYSYTRESTRIRGEFMGGMENVDMDSEKEVYYSTIERIVD